MDGMKKVLMIDDEEDFVEVIKLNLESTGYYEVMGLVNAKDTLAAIYSFRPNVILLDMLMPEVTGLQVCEMLKDDPIGKGIPIIILSASGSDTSKIKAFKLKVSDYLEKPAEVGHIIRAIQKALELGMAL